jgi:tetratricopeptide (TPR) repeat protein
MVLSPAGRSGVSRAFVAIALIAPLLCLALPLLSPRGAVAAAATAAAGDKASRELFQRAEKSFNLGRFPEALADYQAAYEAKPLPAFLFNIAQCYRNMQSFERARFFFRRYLALDPKTTNRRLVEDLISEMTRELDKQEKAEKIGKPDQGDDQAPAPVALAAPAVAPPVPLPPAPPPPTPALALDRQAAPEEEPHPIYKRWWFWAGAGAIVAAGVVGAIFALRPADPQGSLGTIKGHP